MELFDDSDDKVADPNFAVTLGLQDFKLLVLLVSYSRSNFGVFIPLAALIAYLNA